MGSLCTEIVYLLFKRAVLPPAYWSTKSYKQGRLSTSAVYPTLVMAVLSIYHIDRLWFTVKIGICFLTRYLYVVEKYQAYWVVLGVVYLTERSAWGTLISREKFPGKESPFNSCLLSYLPLKELELVGQFLFIWLAISFNLNWSANILQ